MFDYLVEHALSNVWCTPDQDDQYIYKPARITGPRGVRRMLSVEWQTIFLPNSTDSFHVYQIGQIHPLLLGLKDRHKTWYSGAETSELESVVLDFYLGNGIQYPRFECYIQVMGDRNLLLAVKLQPKLPDLEKEPLFFRVYSNAFLASKRSLATWKPLVVRGITVASQQQMLTFQRDFNIQRKEPGHTYLFWNGRLVDRFYTPKMAVGDLIEYCYDSSITQVIDWPVKSLQTFDSDLDLLRKYLLHHPKQVHETIEYRDDLDFWVIKPNDQDGFDGVYYHKNQANAVRMVTHQDYALPVPYVVGFATQVPGWGDVEKLSIRVHIRQSGWDRALVNEHHRIKELYKLPDDQVVRAMLGVDSTVDVWRAPALEASQYPAIMDAEAPQVTALKVQQAYGYNAVAKLMADTPQLTRLDQGQRVVDLPPGLRAESTVYEYNSKGRLLGFYNHSQQDQYMARDRTCALVEAVVGIGGTLLTTIYQKSIVPLLDGHNYRFYKTPIHLGAPLNQWEDVTGSEDYTVDNGIATWLVDPEYWYTCVRNDQNFLAYNYRVTPTDGLLRFSITAKEYRNGLPYTTTLQIPMGSYALWLNGYPLIEGLDFTIIGAQVVITNKEYWVAGAQVVTVRCMGFCDSALQRIPPAEVGWVDHGVLSHNSRFNLRDDQIIRLVVKGAVRRREELVFAEDTPQVTLGSVPNGAPYTIENLIVPIRGLQGTETYAYRAESLQVDQAISDYMSLHLPELPYTTPNLIPDRYTVYSPFACKILNDLKSGILAPAGMSGHYNEMDLKGWLSAYEWLLPYDPCLHDLPDRYVAIHPHNLYVETSLNIYQYNLLDRAVKFYLNDRVDLSQFVQVL